MLHAAAGATKYPHGAPATVSTLPSVYSATHRSTGETSPNTSPTNGQIHRQLVVFALEFIRTSRIVRIMKTVIETTEFQRQAANIWSDEERLEFVSYIAKNPLAGDVIPGAKAARKIRWQATGRGKRGGARVVYYNWTDEDAVVLLTVYTKSARENITAGEIERLKK